MSHTDLHQLSKKNQEFIRIAKHQLLENGKTEEEAESLIQEILPAIHENQGKGIPARTLFGAPTVWANSFSEKERYEKEHPKLNDAPSLMILDSFLFIFGVFAAISAFYELGRTASYWLWVDHLDPWKFDRGSALVSHVLLLLSVYGWHKRSQ